MRPPWFAGRRRRAQRRRAVQSPAFARPENEGVYDCAEAKEAQQFIDQESDHRDDVQHQSHCTADEYRDGGVPDGPRPPAGDAPAEPSQHDRFAEQARAKKCRDDERYGGNADQCDAQQDNEYRSEQHGQQRGQRRWPGWVSSVCTH